MGSEWHTFQIYKQFRFRTVVSRKKLRKLLKKYGDTPNLNNHACCYCYCKDGYTDVIVHFDRNHWSPNITSMAISSLISHEAIHVKRWLFEEMNEKHPSTEFEAYTQQWIVHKMREDLFGV